MIRRLMRGVAPLVVVAGVLLVVSTVAGGNPVDPRRISQITATEAVAAVRAFDPDRSADVAVQRTMDGALGRGYEVEGSALTAIVDVFDGRVVLLEIVGAVEAKGRAGLDAGRALQVAQAFLAAHSVSVDHLGQPTVVAEDHGDIAITTVTWQRVSSSGVLLPDQRIVNVNPSTGQVSGFVDLRRPFADPPASRISEDQAVSIAAAASGVAHLQHSQLLVTFSSSGTQLLVWRLSLLDDSNDPTIQAAIVDIDALSGEVIQVSPAS